MSKGWVFLPFQATMLAVLALAFGDLATVAGEVQTYGGTANHPGFASAAGLKNLALGSLCAPEPFCHLLIDGSTKGFERHANMFTAHRGLRGRKGPGSAAANGTGIEAGDMQAVAAATSAKEVQRFHLFLNHHPYVARIIVYLSPSAASGLPRMHSKKLELKIMAWTKEDRALAHAGHPLGPPSLFWDKPVDEDEEEEEWPDTSEDEKHLLRGRSIMLDVGHMIVAVAVEWARSDDGLEPGLEITEVAVMSSFDDSETEDELDDSVLDELLQETEEEEADVLLHSRKASAILTDRLGGEVTSNVLGTAYEGESKRFVSTSRHSLVAGRVAPRTSPSDEKLPARESHGQKRPLRTTMAPVQDDASELPSTDNSALVGLSQSHFADRPQANSFLSKGSGEGVTPRVKALIGSGLPATCLLVSVLGVAAVLLPKLLRKDQEDRAYDRLPEADLEESHLAEGISGRGWIHESMSNDDAALPTVAAGSSDTTTGSASTSRSTSPAGRGARSTESEPEGEPPGEAPASSQQDPEDLNQRSGFRGRGPILCTNRMQTSSPEGHTCTEVGTISKAQVPRLPVGHNTPQTVRGQVMLLYASPLCYLDQDRRPRPMVQIPFEKEWGVIVQAHNEAKAALREGHCGALSRRATGGRCGWFRPGASMAAGPLTAGSLQRMVAPASAWAAASVLQLSAHGDRGRLVLEACQDGKGTATAHCLSSEALTSMLELRNAAGQCKTGGLRLLILNCCSLRAAGAQFAQGGIPHVICCAADLMDSASLIFLFTLYSSLFQGSTVSRAFLSAKVALCSSSEAAAQAVAQHFVLLPEDKDHDEVLFPPEWIRAPIEGPLGMLGSSDSGGALTSSGRLEGLTPPPADGNGSSTESTEEASTSGAEPRSSAESNSRIGCSSPEESTSSSDCDTTSSGGVIEDDEWLPPQPDLSSRANSAREARLNRLLDFRGRSPLATGQRRGQRGSARTEPSTSGPTPLGRGLKPRRSTSTANLPEGPLCSPFAWSVPAMPEDFLGRAVDVWHVLRYLSTRRAVVVCGAEGQDHGVGKTAVLDAVHRSYVLQMGGVCIAVPMRSLSQYEIAGAGAGGWIEKIQSAVTRVHRECRERWTASTRAPPTSMTPLRVRSSSSTGNCQNTWRRRAHRGPCILKSVGSAVRHGFHPLSDPVAAQPQLDELIEDLMSLTSLCEVRRQDRPAGVVLLLDECDHLIQQEHFQAAIADVLHRCPLLRIVLSTHQRMVGTAGGHFKVVHHAIEGLPPREAARLFLRRAQRVLRWGELAGAELLCKGGRDARSPVVINQATENEVLQLVATHPAVAAQCGNPRRLIELASRVGPSLPTLWDLAPLEVQTPLARLPTQAPRAAHARVAVPPAPQVMGACHLGVPIAPQVCVQASASCIAFSAPCTAITREHQVAESEMAPLLGMLSYNESGNGSPAQP